MKLFYIFLVSLSFCSEVLSIRSAFDNDLYERVLDPVACQEQLVFLRNDSLGLYFVDTSAKLPSGILTGNLVDLGKYHECLAIHQTPSDLDIQGKYCTIRVPLNQNPIQIPGGFLPELTPGTEDDGTLELVTAVKRELFGISDVTDKRSTQRALPGGSGGSAFDSLSLAICIPKVCSVNQTMSFLLDSLLFLNLTYEEVSCRLPNDKPLAPADFISWTIFVILFLFTTISTSYDMYTAFVLKKVGTPLYRSFSVYTNTRRFLTFSSGPGTLDCLDGIRVISMLWVVVGHTFVFTMYGSISNILDIVKWVQSASSTWLTSAPISVDTFLMLSGVLCTYTTVGKVTRGKFIQNIYIFYLHRLLRMFPLLAVMVLYQASWAHHVSDGPQWGVVGSEVESCRKYWWSALLHVQNYYNNTRLCLGQSWYLSVDVQLYLLSPLVLVWLFGKRPIAWSALSVGILASLVSASIYCYTYNFPGVGFSGGNIRDYISLYYFNTLTRAPPFAIGLLFGYLLKITKGSKIRIPRLYNIILWAISLGLMSLAIIPIYFMSQTGYSNQGFDNFFNAYVRALWSVGLGWTIFACVHGYGGPINWFLCLPMWKLPARLSYAIYLFHVTVIVTASASRTVTHHFTPIETLYRFSSDLSITTLFAFILCVTVDAPFSTLQKMLLSPPKKPLHTSNGQETGKVEEQCEEKVADEHEEIGATVVNGGGCEGDKSTMVCEKSKEVINCYDGAPKEKGYGWGIRHLQIACMTLGVVVLYITRSCMGIAVLAMTENRGGNSTDVYVFNWDKQTQGMILSSFFWGYILMQIPGSLLAKRFGGWIVIMVGTLCNAAVCLTIPLLAKWGDWPLVCIARVTMGLTQACLYPTTHTLLGRWLPSNELTTYSGIVYGGAQIGTMISMPVSGLLAESALGWKMIFYFCSANMLVFAVIWGFFAASSPAEHRMISDEERFYIERDFNSSVNHKSLRTPWREILCSPKFWAIFVTHVGCGIFFMFFFVDLPSYLEKGLDISLKASASLSALPYVGMWIGGVTLTKLCDFMINKNILSRITCRKLFNSIGMFGVSAGLAVMTFVTLESKTLAVVTLVMSLTLGGSIMAGFMVNHLDLSPNYAGVMLALTNMGSIIGCITTPLIISLILHNDPTDMGRWRIVFIVIASLAIFSNIVYLIFAGADLEPWDDPDYRRSDKKSDIEEMKPVLEETGKQIVIK